MGFPSPAADYVETRISLDQQFIRHPSACLLYTSMEVEAMSLALSFMPKLSDVAKQTAMVRAVNDAAGIELLPLPKLEEHYHSASEVGELLGVSAQKIGRVANANKLKSEEYGIFVMDKSAHSSKQVEAFRYNAEGVKACLLYTSRCV